MEVLEKCELFIENLKSFVRDGANVMVGERNGVAARLKRLHQSIVNLHCICHKLALMCGDSGDQINYIKDVETTLTSICTVLLEFPKEDQCFRFHSNVIIKAPFICQRETSSGNKDTESLPHSLVIIISVCNQCSQNFWGIALTTPVSWEGPFSFRSLQESPDFPVYWGNLHVY